MNIYTCIWIEKKVLGTFNTLTNKMKMYACI